jgi:hypothetical protein
MARKRSDAHRRVSLRPWARARWTPGEAQRVLEACGFVLLGFTCILLRHL